MGKFVVFWLITIMALALDGCTQGKTPDAERADLSAREIIARALEAHGGIDIIRRDGVTISLDGTFDLTVRLQGRSPDRPEPTPIRERISVDVEGGRVGYDIDWFNYYSSNQILREIYDSERRILFIDRQAKNGGYMPRQSVVDAQDRYMRNLPNLLLAEVIEATGPLTLLPPARVADRDMHAVSYETPAGAELYLLIDAETNLLHSSRTSVDMPLLGSVNMAWVWRDYQLQPEFLMVPGQFTSVLGKSVLKKGRMAVVLGTSEEAFLPPDNIEVGDPPAQPDSIDNFIPYGERPVQVETVGDGVHMVRSLRPGFHLMFVEFADFVLAVDAPTGWYEMLQIPPKNWSIGDDIDALGRKYLRAIAETAPDKPVNYLVLSHHHSDHIGGFMPFADAGATFLAGAASAKMITNRPQSMPGGTNRITPLLASPEIEIVRGTRTIRDDTMEVQLIELPDDNPKADNYLMVYLPKQKILYTTGFVYPVPESVFPLPESVELSIWFVEWLDQSGLDVEKIYNVHGLGLVEDWQLEQIREIAVERNL